MILSFNRLEFK